MRKSGGLFFAIAALIITLAIWGNPINRLVTVFSPPPLALPNAKSLTAPSSSNPSSPESPSPEQIDLSVDVTQLMPHVEALAQPRFSPRQKAKTREYITAQLTAYGLTAIQQPYQNAASNGVNIVATLPGRNPSTGTIILGAHYDTTKRSPGADDNGSAIATLLEAARIFSASTVENRPNRNLTLVFFDQEEHQLQDNTGLLGSLAFTKQADNLTNVKGAVILDMIGYACRTAGCQNYPARLPLTNVPDTGDFLAVLGRNTDTDLLDAFMLSAQTNWPLVLTLPIPAPTLKFFPDLLRSDHAPFWNKDIPAVFVTDTANFRNPNYHTETDTPGTLDGSFFQGSAQHVVNAITTLLNATER